MAAVIVETEDGLKVQAAPGWPGGYGFGTLGTRAGEMFDEAWRMVQRAGITRITSRESARIVSTAMHTTRYVEFDVVEDVVARTDADPRVNAAFLRAYR